MTVEYSRKLPIEITPELIKECSDLYSEHYGIWSHSAPRHSGQKIKLSPERIRELLTEEAWLYLAKTNDKLIGYAVAIRLKVKKPYGICSWVTQLVVREEYRNKGIAKELLFSIWGMSDDYAWGIISSNPFAIRALEKATRRRCAPQRILKNHKKMLSLSISKVPYVKGDIKIEITRETSKINTQFFVDHSMLDKMIQEASTNAPWLLGSLEEGWEWFAFTFKDQEQIGLTTQEIEKMIEVSDQVTKQAYSRMQLGNSHLWARHTEKESDLIIDYCKIEHGYAVLDLGCGIGRHSISLAKRGLKVTGVDYIKEFIDRANSDGAKELQGNRPRFVEGDCRNIELGQKFNAIICLYDVVGTYTDNAENLKILKNIVNHLRPDGQALISVMNLELTKHIAKHTFSLKDQPNKLLEIPASKTMAQTGQIFDSEHYILDNDTSVVYRKEQFTEKSSLPVELIVRDRRFHKDEIEEMCRSVGLEVLWSRFVGAGTWSSSLHKHDSGAKEILLLCKKRDG